MKKIFIVISHKKLYRTLAFIAAAAILVGGMFVKITFFSVAPVYDGIEEQEIADLEKENSKLKQILESIIPENNQVAYEDQYRNRYANFGSYTPPSFEIFSLQKVLRNGADVKYNVLSNKPGYLRPLYDPSWKGAYYRNWLYLPEKNIDARHRLFIYPSGGSAIYDFTGTLALEDSTVVNYHLNINLLIYGFKIESIKYYENQVALVGEPLRKGLQIISIAKDDLLPGGIKTRDILLQLVTPQGYEIDFIYENVFKSEYPRKKIEESTVILANAVDNRNESLEQLTDENLYLK